MEVKFRWWRWSTLRSPYIWISFALYLALSAWILHSPEIKQYWLFSVIFLTPLIVLGLLIVPLALLFISFGLHFIAQALVGRSCNFEVVRVEVLRVPVAGSHRSWSKLVPSGVGGFLGFISMLPRSSSSYQIKYCVIQWAGVLATLGLFAIVYWASASVEDKNIVSWLAIFALAPFLRALFPYSATHSSSNSASYRIARQMVDAWCSGYDISTCPDWMYEIALEPQAGEANRVWLAPWYASILCRREQYAEAGTIAKIFADSESQFERELIAFIDFMQGGSETGLQLATETYNSESSFYGFINRAFLSFYAGDRNEAHYRLREMQNGYHRYQLESIGTFELEFAAIQRARAIMKLPAHNVHARNGVLAGGEDACAETDA
jgi:hypothetical protein